jgi:dTDP-4-dehydrorhamnose 3,5-epimerase
VFIAEGLGHAFMALSEQATLVYLCSEQYNPQREHGVDPFDADLAIDWPGGQRGLTSARDASAPGLRELAARGALPDWRACQDLYRVRSS